MAIPRTVQVVSITLRVKVDRVRTDAENQALSDAVVEKRLGTMCANHLQGLLELHLGEDVSNDCSVEVTVG